MAAPLPLLPESAQNFDHPHPETRECIEPSNWDGPWTSGNGIGGGLFESWFGIREGYLQPDYQGDRK